jgi:hypothetical protein
LAAQRVVDADLLDVAASGGADVGAGQRVAQCVAAVTARGDDQGLVGLA